MNKRGLVVCLITLGLQSVCAAVSVDMTLYADSDASIKSVEPDTNFGSETHVQWACTSEAPYVGVKGYYRFRLPKESIGKISSATLRFVRSGPGPWNREVRLSVLNDDAPGQDWEESDITWNSAPANIITNYGFAADVTTLITAQTLLGRNSGVTNGEPWVISAGLVDVLNEDTDQWVTFALEWGGLFYHTGEYFAARENTTYEGAQLEISYEASADPDVKTLASQRWHAWRGKQSEFPLAAWSYFLRYDGTQEDYQVYRDAGLNMVQAPYDQCHAATNATGLNLLLGSWESLWNDPAKLAHYLGYPAYDSAQVAGYVLYDEPHSDYFDELATATETIYRLDERDAIPIVDHLPNWAVGYDRFELGDGDGGYYETYINKFVAEVSPCVMLNSHYPIMADGSDRPQYYANIEYFRTLSLENDIGLMGFVLVNEHQSYRMPSESDLNWMVYSYLAYGAKGLFYWNYQIEPITPYGEGLVTHADGTPLPVYSMVQAVNSELDNLWPIVKSLESVSVFHVDSIVPDGTTRYTNGDVEALANLSATNWIVSEFVNRDNVADTNRYVMLVNKNHGAGIDSLAAASTVMFTADSDYPYVSMFSPLTGEETILRAEQGAFQLALGGGKAALLKFSAQLPATVSITPVLDTYIHQGNPTVDFAASSVLLAQNSSQFPDRNRKIYLKYILPEHTTLPDGAAFEMTPSSIYNPDWVWTYNVYGLVDSAAGNNWTSINWNNAPANDTGSATGFSVAETELLGQFSGGGLSGVARTVASTALNEFIRSDQDGVVTLMVVRASDSSANDAWAPSESLEFVAPRLKLTYSPMETWALEFGLHGPNAMADADPDGDRASNFYEFAFGGNPTNANLAGRSITGRIIRDEEATWMELVYTRRIGGGLVYTIQQSTNLVSGGWTTTEWMDAGAGDIMNQVESVTNRSVWNDLLSVRYLRVWAHGQ